MEERYPTHADYVRIVTDAANNLVKDGYLGRADATAMIAQAEASTIAK